MATASTARPISGRGKAALALDWWPHGLPAGTQINPATVIAQDGEVSRGTLYSRGAATTVFCLMHPRQDMRQHPLIPALLQDGYAVWAQVSREVGNDLRLVHESVLLDVAAGCEHLLSLGYEQIVLVGMSGGAGLYSFYTQQSQRAPSDRLAKTPDGSPIPLPDANLPAPDRLVLVAPHPGQGRLLLTMIDPSVTDEGDPFSVDAALDPFDPGNGFGEAPEGSHYAPEFIAAYRTAQIERVRRIDDHARELVAARQSARKRHKGGSGDRLDQRKAILTPIITTYRTDADLRCTDLSLDPSDRPYGSVISARPAVSNYGVNGFGRLTTPEAWLSTWSGLSSNALLERTLTGVTVPTLLIEFTGDCSVFPSDVQSAIAALASDDVTHLRIRSDHFGRPLTPEEESGIAGASREILEWDQKRGGS